MVRDVKYNAVEKNVRGPRMTSKTNESRMKFENEWQEKIRGQFGMAHEVRDDFVRPTIPSAAFPKE